jgi:hypothetical protein
LRAKIKAVVPVWSHNIEVVRQADDALLISGYGYIPRPFIPDEAHPEEFLLLDFTHKLRRYVLRRLGKDAKSDGPDNVYQFANATTDEKLIAFVEEFGPIHGKVVAVQPLAIDIDDDSCAVTVRETLRSLRREQRQFRRMVEIIQQVNHNARADFDVLRGLLMELAGHAPMSLSDDWLEAVQNLMHQYRNPSRKILSVAHQLLCYFFNQYPPGLFPVADGVVELPRIRFSGVRDALYFQLRLDYLAQRTIGTCLHCHEHFVVYRRGTAACSESCSRALRNAKYWDSNKETINASRRGNEKESRKSKVSGRTSQESFTGKQVLGKRRMNDGAVSA